MARKRSDIGKLRDQVGTFEAPIGSVQLPETGVRYDKRGNPKPLQSGQDEHPEPAAPGKRRKRRAPEPELAFTTDLFVEDPADRAVLTACHKALAGTQLTVKQLRDKLAKAGHEDEAIELGIERCTAAGLLNDERYTAEFVASRVRRGHGAQRIRQDLARKGIDRAMTDAALEGHQSAGELDQGAIDAARKKAARLDLTDAKARAKVLRWLVSRGFSSGQAYEALRTIEHEHADLDG